eukprot:scaffold19124_cov24-Cyclotella_meneghiniana.AAC.1
MKSIMSNANTAPLLSQALDDKPEREQGCDKRDIEGINCTRPNQQENHSWFALFLCNIFLANAISSFILPILAPYLTQIGIRESYLQWVIFMHNIGAVIGSATIGVFYDYVTRIYQVEGRGAKICLLMCPLFGIVGSVLYGLAGWIGNVNVAMWFVLFGRFLHGIWRGGQHSVELGEENSYRCIGCI